VVKDGYEVVARDLSIQIVQGFLRVNGIDSAKIYLQKYGYTLRVFKISAVKEILANMLPYSFLKREQINAGVQLFQLCQTILLGEDCMS